MKTMLKKSVAIMMLTVCTFTFFTGCAELDIGALLGIEYDEEEVIVDQENATAGGETVVLPENLPMPETANKISGMLVEGTDTYVATIYLSQYRSDSYLFINGNTLTVDANFYLTDANGESVEADEGYRDVKVVLWEKGPNQAEYVETAHFEADGTNQTYTFKNLTPGGEYRIAITFSAWWAHYVNGNYRLSSISATGSEEETVAEE